MMNWRSLPKMKTFRLLMIGCCVALLMNGCASGEEGTPVASTKPSGQTTASPASSTITAATPTPLPFTFPLTGLPSAVQVKTRPYMVMVENSPQARPQSGLDQADIVYEILAEGDITRFVSVFQSQDAKTIGPVRSIRPYFVEIGDMLDAVIVHAGWSQDAMNILSSRKLNHLDQVYGDDAFYWRAKDRKAPHNLYTSVAKISEGATARKFRADWKGPTLTFSTNGKSGLTGTAATKIQIPYLNGYKVSYDYDATAAVYKRSMNGAAHLDKESGAQLQTVNLLVLESKHKILDNAGRREVDVFGPGKGTIFQQGQSQSVTWERKDGLIRVYADGKEIPLLPGNTWVQFVPVGTSLVTE